MSNRKKFGLGLGFALFLVACGGGGGGGGVQGIATLGADFVRAFNLDPKTADEDIPDADDINLVLTPKAEPFDV